VTTEEGILFVQHPPSLNKEPPFEDWADKANPAKAITALLKHHDNKSSNDFTPSNIREWCALRQMHQFPHAHAVPLLPHTAVIEGTPETRCWLPVGEQFKHTFDGTPKKCMPILKELRRFERPLITWPIFDEDAPSEWPSFTPHEQRFHTQRHAQDEGKQKARRDPAQVNSVTHKGYSQADRKRVDGGFLDKEWAEDQEARVQELQVGHYYLVEQDHPQEPWMKLSLAQVVLGEDKSLCFRWYGRTGAKQNKKWASTVSFYVWGTTDPADLEAARLEVTPDWTTKNTAEAMERGPTITAEWRRKIEWFARREDVDLVDDQALSKHQGKSKLVPPPKVPFGPVLIGTRAPPHHKRKAPESPKAFQNEPSKSQTRKPPTKRIKL
jgi:hypothetical protein